ncbi:MAG: PRC-barrel domain-containing protein [Candidatus Aenigmarchaeota archaeon]|nr:PRC-barrel domain-containing protein [Candidatus Aenigmarchaeota archaeon]
MAGEERIRARNFVGKIVVSEETGRKFGTVGDISFITESGELMNLVMVDPTKHADSLNLQEDKKGRHLIPFSSVKSVGDFVIISEEEVA